MAKNRSFFKFYYSNKGMWNLFIERWSDYHNFCLFMVWMILLFKIHG